MGAELASLVTILVREPGRVTTGGGEPLVLSRGSRGCFNAWSTAPATRVEGADPLPLPLAAGCRRSSPV